MFMLFGCLSLDALDVMSHYAYYLTHQYNQLLQSTGLWDLNNFLVLGAICRRPSVNFPEILSAFFNH